MKLAPNSSTTSTPNEIASEYAARWNNLKTFLNKWFYKPDIQALKIALSIYTAHTYLEDDPVWAFIIGPPGSGKTSVIIRGLNYLPNTHMLSSLSTSAFLSGYGDDNGVLQKLAKYYNSQGCLLFPDFTTFLNQRPDVREDISGQLRSIYDGHFSRQVGNKGNIEWNGKVTVIAACTPAIEDYWALNRGLGERFMYVRWTGNDLGKTAEYAVKQIGNEEEINKKYERRLKRYVDPDTIKPTTFTPDWGGSGIVALAKLVAKLRVSIKRENIGAKRVIVSVDPPEFPTRIMKSLSQVVRGSITLDRREEATEKDYQLARRIAMDTLPPHRVKILKALVASNSYEARTNILRKVLPIPTTSFYRVLEDLNAIGATESYTIDEDEKVVSLKPEYAELCLESKLSNLN